MKNELDKAHSVSESILRIVWDCSNLCKSPVITSTDLTTTLAALDKAETLIQLLKKLIRSSLHER